jgi:hypothetical protein
LNQVAAHFGTNVGESPLMNQSAGSGNKLGLDVDALIEELKVIDDSDRGSVLKAKLLEGLEPDDAITVFLGELIDSVAFHISLAKHMNLPVIKSSIVAWLANTSLKGDSQAAGQWENYSHSGCDVQIIDCGHWELMETSNVKPIIEKLADMIAMGSQNEQ